MSLTACLQDSDEKNKNRKQDKVYKTSQQKKTSDSNTVSRHKQPVVDLQLASKDLV